MDRVEFINAPQDIFRNQAGSIANSGKRTYATKK